MEARRKHGRNSNGFSLLEMVIVLVIFGVLAAIATPVMMRWVPNKRLKAATRDIASAMVQARAEAIRRGDRVALVFDCGGDAENNDGLKSRFRDKQLFVMFVDNGKTGRDENGHAEPLPSPTRGEYDSDGRNGEEIVMSAKLPNRVVVNRKGGGAPSTTFAKNALVFSERGIPVGAGGGFGGGTIRLCTTRWGDTPSDTCRTVKVSSAGRITTGFD